MSSPLIGIKGLSMCFTMFAVANVFPDNIHDVIKHELNPLLPSVPYMMRLAKILIFV